MQMPIPDDWDGETWGCYLIEWPKSQTWESILYGFITTPTRGRFWDARSGSILGVQAIGEQIEERNSVMSCEDIVAQLQAINNSLQSIGFDPVLEVNYQVEIANKLEAVANAFISATQTQTQDIVAVNIQTAIAQSNSVAWSNAYAEATAPVQIINNVSLEARPLLPGTEPAPTAEEEAGTSLTPTLHPADSDETCKRAFWLAFAAQGVFKKMVILQPYLARSALAYLGGISSALSTAALTANGAGRTWVVPAAVLLNVAHAMQELRETGQDFATYALIEDAVVDGFGDLVCLIKNGLDGLLDTQTLQQNIDGFFAGWGVSPLGIAITHLIFNLNSLGGLYYVSSIMDVFPDIPAELGGSGFCDGCGG